MPKSGSKRSYIRFWPQALVLLFAALLVACGSSATSTPVPSSSAPTPTEVPSSSGTTSSSAPTSAPKATQAPAAAVEAAGTINMGQKETGIFEGHPGLSSSPRIQFTSSSVGEGLITTAVSYTHLTLPTKRIV